MHTSLILPLPRNLPPSSLSLSPIHPSPNTSALPDKKTPAKLPVPSFGTFTAGRFTGGDAKSLGGNSHRTLDLELLVFGALDQIGAHLFQALHISEWKRERVKQLIKESAKETVEMILTTISRDEQSMLFGFASRYLYKFGRRNSRTKRHLGDSLYLPRNRKTDILHQRPGIKKKE